MLPPAKSISLNASVCEHGAAGELCIFHVTLEPICLTVCSTRIAGTLLVPLQQTPGVEGANVAGLTLKSTHAHCEKRLVMIAVRIGSEASITRVSAGCC